MSSDRWIMQTTGIFNDASIFLRTSDNSVGNGIDSGPQVAVHIGVTVAIDDLYSESARFHLACAAREAISDRRFLLSDSARAFPPFRPPRRPSMTAAGFFFFTSDSVAGAPTTASKTDRASCCVSFWRGLRFLGFLLERLGMPA
jgi:hypothetical protein